MTPSVILPSQSWLRSTLLLTEYGATTRVGQAILCGIEKNVTRDGDKVFWSSTITIDHVAKMNVLKDNAFTEVHGNYVCSPVIHIVLNFDVI